MARYELTDQEWERLAPLLPLIHSGKRGHPWTEHRAVLNGILWILRTGAPWADLPERYPPRSTCNDRLRRWKADGTWDRILQQIQAQEDQKGNLLWGDTALDATIVRAHQHAAGARRLTNRAQAEAPDTAARSSARSDASAALAEPVCEVTTEALGRSRGGLTTKLHLLIEGRGRPLSLHLTAGQVHESTQAEATLDKVRVPRPRRGRPRKRPVNTLTDKGYNGKRCRRAFRSRRIQALIPTKSKEREARRKKGPQGGRPFLFDAVRYKRRNLVERCINRLKQFRRVATRYDKRAESYLAFITFASILIWLRS